MTDHAPETPDEFELPELTRHLRAFGSGRALPGSDHDRYFAPLVVPLRELRTRHERAVALGSEGEPWRAAETMDAKRAADALRSTIAALAAERFPAAAPDRRALEAELLDEAEGFFAALVALGEAAVRLRAAPDEARPHAWRVWCAELRGAFAAADRAWQASLPALVETALPPRRGA